MVFVVVCVDAFVVGVVVFVVFVVFLVVVVVSVVLFCFHIKFS